MFGQVDIANINLWGLSEFRHSLRVLHTRTNIRVDGCTSGDIEFLVPVAAWNLVTSEIMHGSLLCICSWGFQANTSLLFLSSWILYDHDGFLSYLVGSQSQVGASGFIRFIRPNA